MSHGQQNPLDHPEVQNASVSGYLTAFLFGLGAMLIALWLVMHHSLSPVALATAVGLIALVTVLVQLYFLFKLDMSESQMWHTIAMAMTVPLFIIAVALTMWMFHTLMLRTMLPGM